MYLTEKIPNVYNVSANQASVLFLSYILVIIISYESLQFFSVYVPHIFFFTLNESAALYVTVHALLINY